MGNVIEIIAAFVAIAAAVIGAFVGNIWGRMRGEADGRMSALQDIERAQANAYRKAREKADEATRHVSSDDARDYLRTRHSGDQ